MSPAPPKLFDRQLHRLNRDRAASAYSDYAFLKQRESSHLIERLEDVTRRFERALDLGAHDGTMAKLLMAHPQVETVEAGEPIAGVEIAGRWVDVRDPDVLRALRALQNAAE